MQNYAEIYRHLLGDLSLSGFSQEVGYVSDYSPKLAACKALADSFYKKLAPHGNLQAQEEAALKKFLAINSSIPEGPFEWSADSEAESCFWDYLRDNFRKTLGQRIGPDSDSSPELDEDENFNLAFIRKHMNVGPGAAQKADSSSMYHKLFLGPLSFTNSPYLISLYRAALVETGLWCDAEKRRNEKFGFPEVEGGKLFFVPKNNEVSRTCCVEATLNMLFQKSLGAFCEKRLNECFGINLSIQPDHNRRLAWLGSLSGEFGTIDLVSASDSIQLRLFDALMEEGFTKAIFQLSRSEAAVLPDGSSVGLRMISTMGNGYTFPLQTVIFACVVRSVYQLMGLPSNDPSQQFGVFGDDIIVHRKAYDFVCRMLQKLGFTVNVSKSFNTGPFRESCGHDYFLGYNIRGVYVKTLETPQSVCSAINRLTNWSARHGVPLPTVIGYLLTLVPKVPRVPISDSDDAGLKVPFTRSRPRVTDDYAFRYRRFKVITRKLPMDEPDGEPNPFGAGLAFLSGTLRRRDRVKLGVFDLLDRDLWISLRDPPDSVPRYKVVSDCVSFWDYNPARTGMDTGTHRRWKALMRDLLTINQQ